MRGSRSLKGDLDAQRGSCERAVRRAGAAALPASTGRAKPAVLDAFAGNNGGTRLRSLGVKDVLAGARSTDVRGSATRLCKSSSTHGLPSPTGAEGSPMNRRSTRWPRKRA